MSRAHKRRQNKKLADGFRMLFWNLSSLERKPSEKCVSLPIFQTIFFHVNSSPTGYLTANPASLSSAVPQHVLIIKHIQPATHSRNAHHHQEISQG